MEWEHIGRMMLALLAGGLIGAEREYRDKAAGFRTIILIAVASCLFTIFSTELVAPGTGDQSRIAAGIVTGVGFLGAGVILRDRGQIVGLTTAATIWAAAALGLGFGAGAYELSLVATAVLLLVLWALPLVETRIDDIRHTQTYHVTFGALPGRSDALVDRFTAHGLKVLKHKVSRDGDRTTTTVIAAGAMTAHRRLATELADDPDVAAFDS